MNINLRVRAVVAISMILAVLLSACSTLAAQQTLEEGNRYFTNGEWEAAIESYSEAIALNPELVAAYDNRGMSYFNLGDYEAAIADFDMCIASGEQDASIYLSRGKAYASLEDYDAAREDFTRAIALDPDLAEAYRARADLLIVLLDDSAASADLEQAGALDPELDLSREWGMIEMMQGDAHRDLNELDDALQHYTAAIEIDPDTPVYVSRGNIYMVRGEFHKAADDYTTALKSYPTFIEAYNNRCIAYFQMGDLEEAFGDCTRAIELIRQDPAACEGCIFPYFWRGQIRAALGDLNAAIADFSAYIEIDDQNAAVFFLRASAYGQLNDYRSAIADYGQAIELNPMIADAYNGRAWYTALLDGDLEQALDDVNRAIALNPDPNFIDTRGMVYYKLGKFDLALTDYNLALDAGLTFSYYGRGLVYEALGETDSAIDDFTDFLTVYPNREPHSSDARQHLLALNTDPWGDVRVEPGQLIQIAVLGPTSGTAASLGQGLREAALLAVEDFGPVQGFEIELVTESTPCTTEGGATAVTQILDNPEIVGVIGPVCSSSVLGALPALERAHVVLISPTATDKGLPLSGPTIFNRVVYYEGQPASPGDPEYAEDLAAVQTFYVAYRSRAGVSLPFEGPVFVAYSYDAVMVLLNALEQVAQVMPDGTLIISRQALADAIRATADYQGLTGSITLEADGDRLP